MELLEALQALVGPPREVCKVAPEENKRRPQMAEEEKETVLEEKRRRQQAGEVVYMELGRLLEHRNYSRLSDDEKEELRSQCLLKCLTVDWDRLSHSGQARGYLRKMIYHHFVNEWRRQEKLTSLAEYESKTAPVPAKDERTPDEEDTLEELREQLARVEAFFWALVEYAAEGKKRGASEPFRQDVREMVSVTRGELTVEQLAQQTKRRPLAIYQRRSRTLKQLHESWEPWLNSLGEQEAPSPRQQEYLRRYLAVLRRKGEKRQENHAPAPENQRKKTRE